jgi:hypothetical protein
MGEKNRDDKKLNFASNLKNIKLLLALRQLVQTVHFSRAEIELLSKAKVNKTYLIHIRSQ